MKKTTIIPIASGKGGVGKSIFAANLAIALARLGHSTIAVDMDLGGSNLYTCLGMPNTYPGIGDFLKPKTVDFRDLPVQTPIPNLKFLPGDGRTPFMANLSYEQRLILLREIKRLSARYVILDLGAGTLFNTLTFFGLAYQGIMITTFETTAVMNCIMFLRNFMFRVLCSAVRQDDRILQMIIQAFRQPLDAKPVTISSLIKMVETRNPALADHAYRKCLQYRPRIIFNMGEHPDELLALPKIDATLKQGISVNLDYFGFIFYDSSVRKSAKNREVFLTTYPHSLAAKGIERIANRILNHWDHPLENSIALLTKEVRQEFEIEKQRKGVKRRN
jgi:flagellar biosynthesis protein FlhG